MENALPSVLITGASGLIGKALSAYLRSQQFNVAILSRNSKDGLYWNPASKISSPDLFKNIDVVIHLSGASIGEKRWTEKRKRELWESRVQSTEYLCELMQKSMRKPSLYIQFSAVGFYGSSRSDVCTESAESGTGFLANLARAWENASQSIEAMGIRRVLLRSGVVLAPHGGVLEKLKPLFLLGLGGPVGNGKQAFPWISLEDVCAAVVWAIHHKISGPCNLVAQQQISQKEFASQYGKILNRPAFLPTPAWVIRLVLGQMGEELLLGGVYVQPQKLLDSGYVYTHTDIESALKKV